MSDPVPGTGIFASVRRLLATALEIAQVRLALLSTEVELEKQRILEGLLWGGVALVFMGVGIVLLCGFITLLFWEGYRLAALGVMTLVFLVSAVLLMREAQKRLRHAGGLFNTSVDELKQDIDGLRTPASHEKR